MELRKRPFKDDGPEGGNGPRLFHALCGRIDAMKDFLTSVRSSLSCLAYRCSYVAMVQPTVFAQQNDYDWKN